MCLLLLELSVYRHIRRVFRNNAFVNDCDMLRLVDQHVNKILPILDTGAARNHMEMEMVIARCLDFRSTQQQDDLNQNRDNSRLA